MSNVGEISVVARINTSDYKKGALEIKNINSSITGETANGF